VRRLQKSANRPALNFSFRASLIAFVPIEEMQPETK
jgi:hypothetical protein